MNTYILAGLLYAIGEVESNSKVFAYNREEDAVGILQIRQCVVADVNKHYSTYYKLEQCYSPEISYIIAHNYLTMWGNKYREETGEYPTYQVYARIWNGGPKGWQKDSTIAYWNKVEPFICQGSQLSICGGCYRLTRDKPYCRNCEHNL